MAIKRGWVEAFHDDELVVALSDLGIVASTLRELGVRFHDDDIKISKLLGLARLTGLTGIETAVGRLEQEPAVGASLARYHRERREAHPGRLEVSHLALLIKGIHLLFAHLYPGWQVTIGKNYRPGMVKGFPHIGGGEGEPTPVDQPFTDAVGDGPVSQDAGHGVRVGLADTRLYPNERLAGRYFGRESDLLPVTQHEFTEFDGHAAFVASCVLQQAPRAELHLRHVLDDNGDGSAWDAAVGVADLAQLSPHVVNLSFGEFMTDDGTAPMVLDAAVRQFSRDTVVVASAGNNGAAPAVGLPAGVTARTASYPAALPTVVGVGAVDPENKPAKFTPPDVPWISLLARGVDVVGAYVDGKVNLPHHDHPITFHGTANWAGCSFAAGVVTGVIAARTVPGQRSAREALEELTDALARQARQGLLLNPAGH
jgi:hypothetical protein